MTAYGTTAKQDAEPTGWRQRRVGAPVGNRTSPAWLASAGLLSLGRTMTIQQAQIPPGIKGAIPKWLPAITEYLELEDAGFNPKDAKYNSYFIVEDSVGFLVFDYTADHSPYARDEGPPFAFLQYSLARGLEDSACIGCWRRTKGQTLVWSISEYFRMNPIPDE